MIENSSCITWIGRITIDTAIAAIYVALVALYVDPRLGLVVLQSCQVLMIGYVNIKLEWTGDASSLLRISHSSMPFKHATVN